MHARSLKAFGNAVYWTIVTWHGDILANRHVIAKNEMSKAQNSHYQV